MLSLFVSTSAMAEGPMPFQSPAVSRTQVAFVYGGGVWLVDRAGGDARRLTSSAGEESAPSFSPDGSLLAFSKNVGGNVDVYVVKIAGGEARRLTYHPKSDVVLGWTPDGRQILFNSGRASDSFNRLYTISAEGGFETELPLPLGQEASYAPDGARLAYAPRSVPQTWRHYRGGHTSLIRIVSLSDARIADTIPHGDSNDSGPMWVGGRVYFLSDRTGTTNLFAYDVASKKFSQLTRFDGSDIKAAGASEDAIVFVQGGGIQLLNLQDGQSRALTVRVAGNFPEVQPREAKAARWIRSFDLSPTGGAVVFGARGEILTMNLDTKEVRNLTQTPGVAERLATWSPDGKSIAYFSDESGEYQLHVRPAGGEGQARKIAVEKEPSFYSEPVWSPDSKRVAFSDKRLSLWYVDLDQGAARKVDTSAFAGQGNFPVAWSPDGRWLAYSKFMPNRLRSVFLYSTETGKSTQVTNRLEDATAPVFERGGRYLFYVSSTNAGPALTFGMSSFPFLPVAAGALGVAVLRNDAPSPLLPAAGKGAQGEASGPLRIDLDGITERTLRLPLPQQDYRLLAAGRAGVIFALANDWSSAAGGGQPSRNVYKFDLDARKSGKFVEGADAFTVSADGGRLMYQRRGNWMVVPTDAQPKPDEGKLEVDRLTVKIDPRAEWAQMYAEVWRTVRDYFYEPGYHGQNLSELKKRYAAYLPNVVSRGDLNYLFRDMIGNLSISHAGVGGGDFPQGGGGANVGLLGADYAVESGRYRITRVYRGDNSSPLLTAPLAQPGVSVRAGEYLLEVDGKEIRAEQNLYSYFEGKAGRPAQIKVGPKPDGSDARSYTVIPVPGENTLRNFAWSEENRRKVEQMSGGKLAYVYLPDTGSRGYQLFNRDFFGQLDKQGVVVDERFNAGGAPADYFIEALRRTPLSAYAFREGQDLPFPANAIPGPRVMIINEYAGSGGDTLPWMFRQSGLGPLVGQRTIGAGIGGYLDLPELLDGGSVSAPNRAFYNPQKGELEIENAGVAPDLAVEITPADWRAGRDPQLEKAVHLALAALQKNPIPAPKRPKYPAYK
ncbi:MAG TPA: PDZ domain-containing protein [Pyrinomonadaceae bacterium]